MPCTLYRVQAMRASLTLLEEYQTIGQGVDAKALTYDRVVHDLKRAAEAIQAATETVRERTAYTCSAPPIRSSLDTVTRPTTVQISHVVCRASVCTCIAVTCRVVSKRHRLRRR